MNADERRYGEGGREDALPVPVRYGWAKRIGVGALVIVVALWGWAWEMDRRLGAEIAKYQAAGEPIYPEDFLQPPVPDEENAAKLYMEAGERIGELSPSDRELLKGLEAWPWNADVEVIGPIVERYGASLAMARRARGMDRFDWGVAYQSPLIDVLLPQVEPARSVARVVHAAALYHHRVGAHGEAVECLLDLLAVGSGIDEMSALPCHMASMRAIKAASQAATVMMADLKISAGESPGSEEQGSASRDAVLSLIEGLLDEDESRKQMVRGLHSDRALYLDMYRCVVDGQMSWSFVTTFSFEGPTLPKASGMERILNWGIKPFLTLDALNMVQHGSAEAEAVQEANLADALEAWPDVQKLVSGVDRWTRPLSPFVLAAHDRAVLLHFQHLSWRRRAAVGLAGRLYEVDHGRKPETVADLVPGYLEAVPLDPMVDDGSVIGLPTWCVEGESEDESEATTEDAPKPKDD